MAAMVEAGELAHLTPGGCGRDGKRINYSQPAGLFPDAARCQALKVLFPEIDALYGVPAPAKWHPEIDTGLHT